MIDRGRHSVLGVRVHAVDLEAAAAKVIQAASDRRPLGVSALAVHGVMTAARDPALRVRVNELELVVPDGQPVRWALNLLHGSALPERVYGPDLMLEVCRLAAAQRLGIFLFGSTPETLERLAETLSRRFPEIEIRGRQASRFRAASEDERQADLETIAASGTALVFAGLGCPRQEIWAWENRLELSLPVLAVGAAFDFHAGTLPQAPPRLQRAGLEWAFRLWQEPRRLWRRYLLLNPSYLALIFLQWLGLRRFPTENNNRPPLIRPG